MQTIKIFFFVTSIIILLIGCSSKKNFTFISSIPPVNNQFTPIVIWKNIIGHGTGKYYSKISPVYDNFVVYGADRRGIIKAIDFNSGNILWSIDLLNQIGYITNNKPILLSSGLTISGDKIYMGAETGQLIALNKFNGKVVWVTNVAGEAISQPVVSDGLVLTHTSNGVLQALDIKNGNIKWSIHLDNYSILSIRGKSAPSIFYGIAIVGSNNGRITAITLSQGEILWQQYIDNMHGINKILPLHDINMTPVIDINLGVIFAVAYNGNLVAINLHSNQIIWSRNLGSIHDIIIKNETIYLVDQNDSVLAIRKSDGVILWMQNAFLYRNLTAPSIYDSFLVMGDGEGYLYWLNVHNGQCVAQNKLNSSGLLTRPIVVNNKLLIQAKDGTLYLLQS
ncbi:outer membrane protein assembly factor BamB [Arsenophonus symbiont of Ornithomya chloropus]|uniref:outer membrane protein assembly factor BamB n=1 Tax=Arsenophonus symbiont of Ornithomya chloropus TaxID=634121 RepID=UPI0032B29DE1